MFGFVCGLGDRIIAHTCRLQAFNCAGGKVTLLTVTVLGAAQYGKKESLRGNNKRL